MFRRSFLLSLAFASLWMTPFLRAELIVSLPDPATISFEQGIGVRTVDLRARSTSADQLFSFTADIRLANAVFGIPSGMFGQSGNIGSGNVATSSFFLRDVSDSKVASLSLDFSAPQLIPTAATPIALLNIDITGLVPGTYGITFLDVSAVSTVGPLAPTSSPGSFTITAAIPEPTSIGLVTVGVAMMFMNARRRSAIT